MSGWLGEYSSPQRGRDRARNPQTDDPPQHAGPAERLVLALHRGDWQEAREQAQLLDLRIRNMSGQGVRHE